MATINSLVYAIFSNEQQAERAVKALVDEEFAAANIHVLMRDDSRRDHVRNVPVQTRTLVGPGVALGATLGAVGGALVALSGGLLAAGPLVALLQGAVSGGAAGTIVGTVGGLGYWRDVVDFPEEKLNMGGILVGVNSNAQGQADRARQALKAAGADEVEVRSLEGAKQAVRQA